MKYKPAYFEKIQGGATKRWKQLEEDPELAGPWHQLFKQVQSPRHVVSELLQNADDAGATSAIINIEKGVFSFKHNGEDFTSEHFSSLCRFGYSNKRALHTIGFRGIGFKSTFSLGDRVELFTPTLSVAFNRQRFTEPIWITDVNRTDQLTEIRVEIADQNRLHEVEKNLKEWIQSPISLLFFHHIRHIRILDHDICWKSLGKGPVNNTEWMILQGKEEKKLLLAKSDFEPFPTESLSEIKQERMLSSNEDTEFPPCQIEIVLGAKGQLFVVLPTGVENDIPFACNAPFIQDPARLKIKDPEISPTNRWLLKRAGKLAASVMLQWLRNDQIDVSTRSKAYSLLPKVDGSDNSLEGICAIVIEEAFKKEIMCKSILLTNEGALKPAKQCIIIPEELANVWPINRISVIFDNQDRQLLSNDVSKSDKDKLVYLGLIERITKSQVIISLQNKQIPKPESWIHLLNLWNYIAPEILGSKYPIKKDSLRIVPVQGKNELYSSSEVVRLGERRAFQSNDDWLFLSTYLLFLDQNWLRFLSDQQKNEVPNLLKIRAEAASIILNAIHLNEVSDVNLIIEKVARELFSQKKINISDCFRLAQIAAKLGATIRDPFMYVTQDGKLHPLKDGILFDEKGILEQLFPRELCSTHLLHPNYSQDFNSCTKEEWLQWVVSERSGVYTFVPLKEKTSYFQGLDKLKKELNIRGVFSETSRLAFASRSFVIEDWDFDGENWIYWEFLAKKDEKLWGYLIERILVQHNNFWSIAKSAKIFQISTTGGSRKRITENNLLPAWIMKLRNLPCIPDSQGFYRKPIDIFRRTTATEPLIGIEPFVDLRFDNESTRELLDLLGVCSTPQGPDRLLDCLRTLSSVKNPPLIEVEKWYNRLDLMLNGCSTSDSRKIKEAFAKEKLILTEDSSWVRATDVYLSSEEDVPGVAILRSSIKELALWRKIGVAERPTIDLAIEWLKNIPTDTILLNEDAKRVQALLKRHPIRIWNECQHWLNLAGEWTHVEKIEYVITMQSLIPWSHLHEWVKRKTADLRLPTEITQSPPFSNLPTLASYIEERFHGEVQLLNHKEKIPWLNQFGSDLCRIVLDNEDETVRIRNLAINLANTTLQITPGLETIPYIEGIPAGVPKRAEVIWLKGVLYVDDLPKAKLARQVPEKLGKLFNNSEITAALNYCFGRSPEDVTEYLEENFKLQFHVEKETIPQKDNLVDSTISIGEETISISLDSTEDLTSEIHTRVDSKKFSLSSSVTQLNVDKGLKISIDKSPNLGINSLNEQQSISSMLHECDKEVTKKAEKCSSHPISRGGTQLAEKVSLKVKENAHSGIEESTTRERSHLKTTKLSMIEKFAYSKGYTIDGDNRFVHKNGSCIIKDNSSLFPWEKRSSTGNVICYYWSKDHCLEQEPLQIEADVWGLIEKFPENHALILANTEGEPIEVFGSHLRSMLNNNKITLHPATYRIVYSDLYE
jgi:hypothetical protein